MDQLAEIIYTILCGGVVDRHVVRELGISQGELSVHVSPGRKRRRFDQVERFDFDSEKT
jgi:hypothetical protein